MRMIALRLAGDRRARSGSSTSTPTADGPRIRGRLGVVPQQDTLDTELSVRDNLVIYGRYFGLSRAEARGAADELLEFAQLTERANDKVEPLSGGMKRRLTIARALINEPSILLLDEPTTGLDPQARHLLWERLYRLKQRGVTLVLTTHYMDEAEQLCDRLVVMDKAKIVAEGSPRQLIERVLDARGHRAPVPGRRPGDARRPARRARRADRAPARSRPRLLRRRRGGRGRGPPARASSPETVLVRRSLARGRVPAPHRAEPHRLMARRGAVVRIGTARAGDGRRRPAPERRRAARSRAYEHMWLLYRRTWRGSIFGSFAQPVLFLRRDGRSASAGTWTQANPAALGGVPYIQFLAPALLVSTVMQGSAFEAHVPGHRRLPLEPPLPRDVRDAADARTRSRSARSPGSRPGRRWSARSSAS